MSDGSLYLDGVLQIAQGSSVSLTGAPVYQDGNKVWFYFYETGMQAWALEDAAVDNNLIWQNLAGASGGKFIIDSGGNFIFVADSVALSVQTLYNTLDDGVAGNMTIAGTVTATGTITTTGSGSADQVWIGTANSNGAIYMESTGQNFLIDNAGGEFRVYEPGGTVFISINHSNNGKLASQNNTLDDGSGNVTAKGWVQPNGSGTTAAHIFSGTGTPQGSVSGTAGDLFIRADGGASTYLYRCTGTTNWTALVV